MTTLDPGAGPVKPASGPPATYRQLTLGECIAIAGIAEKFSRAEIGDVPLRAVVAVIDAMRVCTTCGEVERAHDPDHRWSTACTRYAPRD